MQKKGVFLSLVFLFSAILFCFTMSGVEAAGEINISQLNCSHTYNITASGTYWLNESVNSTVSPLIDIRSDDVLLDCRNFMINATGDIAIRINRTLAYDNITIRNCTIIGAAKSGIHIGGGSNISIYNNTIDTYGIAINISSIIESNFTLNLLDLNTIGFRIYNTTTSTFYTNTITNNNVTGFYLFEADNNTFATNIMTENYEGIYFFANSSNNTFTGDVIRNSSLHGLDIVSNTSKTNTFTNVNITNSSAWDLHLESLWSDNKFYNIRIGLLFPTIMSFDTYSNVSLHINGVENPPTTPAGVKNISRYANITTAGGWIVMNFTYTDADITGLTETSMRMYRYNGTVWVATTKASSVVTASNIVTANLTTFSPFGLFGTETPAVTRGSGGGGGGYYSQIITYPALESVKEIKKILRRRDFLKFNYKSEIHKVTLNQIDTVKNQVTVTIESTPKEYFLELNKAKEIDIDLDGINDIKATLSKLDGSTAELTIEKIVQMVSPPPLVKETAKKVEQTTEQTTTKKQIVDKETPPQEKQFESISLKEEKTSNTWTIIIIILIILAVWMLVKHKKKTKKGTKHKK